MTSFWKKIKGSSIDKSNSSGYKADCDRHISVNLSDTNSPRNVTLICFTDEEPYLRATDGKMISDPLQSKCQLIKSLDILLRECSGLPHFLEFIQIYEIEHYIECWLECDKFRALALSLLKKYNECEEQKITQVRPCTSVTVGRCRKTTHKNNHNKYERENVAEKTVGNILPDLVSSIPSDISVTPNSSPEEPSELGFSTPEAFENISNCTVENNNEILYQERLPCEQILERKKYLNNNLDNSVLGNFNSINENHTENTNNHRTNTYQRLFDFASQLYNKFIDSSSTHAVELPGAIRETVLDNIVTQNIDCNLFGRVQDHVYSFLEKEYLPKYLESPYFLKHAVEIFTSQRITLQDILAFESSLPYFMEYMEQEEGQPLLEFWISAFNFKEHLQKQQGSISYNAAEAQNDAMVLYDKYFSLQATHRLGFSDQIRFLVECNICQEEGPSPNCFDVPLRVVYSVIQRDFLPGYLSSTLHIKFVSELVNTIKISSLKKRKRTASGSTCLSEESNSTNKSSGMVSSISRSNTLLAMDSSSTSSATTRRGGLNPTNNFLKNFDDPNLAMRIDSVHILNPDSLWRRKNFTKLSCGYIDELGRFESELQPDPDHKGESKLSKTLKKFAKVEEKKVREDMAYKVAEMIIKDVTNVTLGDREKIKDPVSPSEQLNNFPKVGNRNQRPASDVFNYNVNPVSNVPSGS